MKQLHETQESLATVQHQLMIEQRSSAETKVLKSQAEQEVIALKAKMDDELRRVLSEKEELVRKLEELNIELRDREVATALVEEHIQVIFILL